MTRHTEPFRNGDFFAGAKVVLYVEGILAFGIFYMVIELAGRFK